MVVAEDVAVVRADQVGRVVPEADPEDRAARVDPVVFQVVLQAALAGRAGLQVDRADPVLADLAG